MEKYLHVLDLQKLLKRVANLNGMGYDKEFLSLVSKPSPYLGDLFGVLVLKEISYEKLNKDFVFSGLAIEEQKTPHSLNLNFGGKFNATFYFNCKMQFLKVKADVCHAHFDYPSYKECHDAILQFTDILEKQNLTGEYLIENKYYAQEKLTFEMWQSGSPTVNITQDNDGILYRRHKDSLYIFPDACHGDPDNVKALLNFVKEHDFDYFACEMIHTDLQPAIDSYLFEEKNSPLYLDAKEQLCDYFSCAWVLKEAFAKKEDNYFIKILDVCKDKKIKVYGVEPADISYVLFRNGETPFGGAVRSAIWATNMPARGRGIIFGGSAHFFSTVAYNLQDFLYLKNSQLKIFKKGAK